MKFTLSNQLPDPPVFVEGIRRAPDRGYKLSPAQTKTALKNALRYIPRELHAQLAPEFMNELLTRGKIYGYRFPKVISRQNLSTNIKENVSKERLFKL